MSPKRWEGVEFQERGFFGVLRIVRGGKAPNYHRMLYHGSTLHGLQFSDGKERRVPTSYFGHATGVGLVLAQRKEDSPRRFGVIGLGVGTLAIYAREGEIMRFYEIDPAVVRVAHDDRYFHYLEDSPAKIDVVVGDARLSLANEQARGATQEFDFLIIDAFSSDAIPVHLLTREAFAHYSDALADGGLMMVHVSNKYLSLMQLVSRLGAEFEFESLLVTTKAAPGHRSLAAKWVMLSRDPNRIRQLRGFISRRHQKIGLKASRIRMKHNKIEDVHDVPVWTDDFSDLFSLLKPAW